MPPRDIDVAREIIQLNKQHQSEIIEKISLVKSAIEDMKEVTKESVTNICYALVGVIAVSLSTWMLYLGMIDQAIWMCVMGIVLSRFFGEAVKIALNLDTKKSSSIRNVMMFVFLVYGGYYLGYVWLK